MHARLHIGQIAQGGATRHIALVGEGLRGHVGVIADGLEHRAAKGIGAVVLVGGFLDDNTAVEYDLVANIALLGVVGVHGMRVVAAHKHRCGKGAMVRLVVKAQRSVDAAQRVGQEGRHGALLGLGANLLVIKAAEDRDIVRVLGTQKCLQRGVGAGQVVKLGRRDKLVGPAPDARVLTIDQEQVAAQDLLGLNIQLFGDQGIEVALLKLAGADERAQVNGSVGSKALVNAAVIYPHEPHNKWEESKKTLKDLFKKYNIDIVAIGNGTASRESEKLVAETISEYRDKEIKYIIVSEAGASVYSASDLAIKEFPDLTVEKRSAISIARRLQDPLSELVKIDSKSIGVGQYQHDVNEKKLDESLDFVVSKCVNNVGVNVNTASRSILKYISGLTKSNIDKIIEYREENGKVLSRDELMKKKVLTPKAYEQSIGFMRIIDGTNPMDVTSIHPESYGTASKLLDMYGFGINDLGSKKLNDVLGAINIKEVSEKLGTDIYTLEDIIKCFSKPNRDFRDDFDKPLLKSDILKIEDLKVGMELSGTVRNVVDFGAFIDIGLHDDGLVHISKMTDKYIKHPSEVVSVGDIVTCYVDDISLKKNRVSLSLINPNSIKN